MTESAEASVPQPQQPLQFEHHRSWEHEASFQDVLANQLRMAPYFLASLAIHAIIGLIFAGFEALAPKETQTVLAVMAPPPPPPVEEQEEPPPPPEEKPIEEPILQESEVEEAVTQEELEIVGDPNFTSDAAFDANDWNNAMGLGAGAGGKYGQRGGRGGRYGRGSPVEQAVEDALKWLADHQTEYGNWDCDEFFYWDKLKDQPPSDGPGNPVCDVGVTGLALLAFLGNGNTMTNGPYADIVRKGITWLRGVQLEGGLFGEELGSATLYNHAIATMAMGEAYYFGRSPLLRPNLEKAVKVILNAQNSYGAWRYSLVPNGDNDTSITGWMIFALKTAEDGKIPVSKTAYDWAEEWFRQMTDPASGRTGYVMGQGSGPGSSPSRKQIHLERFPAEKSESLTAVALLCRIFMSPPGLARWQDHPNYDMMKKQADLILTKLPVWDEAGGSIDLYYWYYATFALYQWGGKHWETWKTAIEKALPGHQRKDGNFKGSWDPKVEPWGDEGGRVYTTALGAIILEVYYRYARVLGAR